MKFAIFVAKGNVAALGDSLFPRAQGSKILHRFRNQGGEKLKRHSLGSFIFFQIIVIHWDVKIYRHVLWFADEATDGNFLGSLS